MSTLNGVVCAGLFMADYPCYNCRQPPEKAVADCFCDCHELHNLETKFDLKPKPPIDAKIVGRLVL